MKGLLVVLHKEADKTLLYSLIEIHFCCVFSKKDIENT